MKLNADIGESFGHWQSQNDEHIMALIDDANIACGYHAGDPLVMHNTIALAKKHKVNIGAHVAYPDLQGFGRRSMHIESHELVLMIQAQIATLEGLAKCQQMSLSHVKPHGALYNDMMRQPTVFKAVAQAVSGYHIKYPLVIQGLVDNSVQQQIAEQYGINLQYEGFADRAYNEQGLLVSRTQSNAILNNNDAMKQADLFVNKQAIYSDTNHSLDLIVDTLCVHGDTKDAIALCQAIRNKINTFNANN